VLRCEPRGDSRDDDSIAQPDPRSIDPSQGDGERFTKTTFFVRDVVRELVDPFGRVDVVSGQGTVVRRGGEEDDVRACAIEKGERKR
jgi:hypothetical protein